MPDSEFCKRLLCEPFAKFRRRRFWGSGEGTGNARDRSALCLNGHKRHKSRNRQVSNLMEASGFREHGSPWNGHKRHKNGIGQDWSPVLCFLWLSRFPFAGQRDLSREKPVERSVTGQADPLLFHANAPFRILQRPRVLSFLCSVRAQEANRQGPDRHNGKKSGLFGDGDTGGAA